VRVTAAFSRLLRLKGVWIRKVTFEPDRVLVEVALKRRRLVCPECGYSTRARKDTRPENSLWRHLDLGIWRLKVHCRRRRLWCPEHGARTEGVPFARPGAEFTRDFECLVTPGWPHGPTSRRSSGCCGSTGTRSDGSSSASATTSSTPTG
jgi:transposase